MTHSTFKVFLDLISLLWASDIAEVSRQSGVSMGTLYNWRNGKTWAPRIDTLTKVAQVYGYELVLQKLQNRSRKAA